MGKVVSRRAMLRRLGTAAVALAGVVATGRGEKAAAKRPTPGVTPMNHCYWRKDYTMCLLGVRRERWYHICCWGLECEVEWCEWRVVGSC